MSGLAVTIFAIGFILLILGNFACQIYVSWKIFGEQGTAQVIKGIIRGNRTFIYGWRWANQLGIKDIMIFWSILVASLLMVICAVGSVFIISGPPRKTQNNSPSIQEVQAPNQPGGVYLMVALQPIKKGYVFTEDDAGLQFGLKHWSEKEIPSGTIISDIIGKTAKVDIEVGQPILSSMLEDR